MSPVSDTLAAAQQFGTELFLKVFGRDNVYLVPETLSKAAARRLRQGLRALEAFLRRAFILLALELEPDLKPSDKEPSGVRYPRRPARRMPHFAIFTGEGAALNSFDFLRAGEASAWRSGPVPATALIRRLAALKLLLNEPEARIKRLAFHLARKRPGLLVAPDHGKRLVPSRYGTEVSALFDAYGYAITQQSRARPPPLPPALRARPRIRVL